jgi:putative transposase
MPRTSRQCPVGLPVHVIQRGNNRQPCFASEADFKAYAHWLHEAALKFGVSIHAWVFMTNHVHLLLTPNGEMAVSRLMQYLGRSYVRYFNFHYQRTGTLWEGRFKSSIVQTRHYLLACQRYIEMNPVRVGMVTDPADYAWSSYRAHALGCDVKMWTPHAEYLELGSHKRSRSESYRQLFRTELGEELISEIRLAANVGLALGNDKFKEEVERLTGQRQHCLKRGPKPKPKSLPREEFLL